MKNFTQRMIKVGIALTSTRDLDRLLDIILTEARGLTNSDAGSVYLARGDRLWFSTSQNETLFNRHGEEETRRLFEKFDIPMDVGSIAGYCAVRKKVLNIPDVYSLPEDYPFRFNSYWDKANNYRSKSMLVLPMLDTNNAVVGVLQLINSKDEAGNIVPFPVEIEEIITSFASEAAVAIHNARLTEELKEAHLETVFRLGVAAEYRDKETANHIRRVSEYSRLLGDLAGLGEEEQELLYWSAAMHDVGKLGVPDAILHKPGLLTEEERRTMQCHTLVGARILQGASCDLLRAAQVVALTHHEKFDGSGYPAGTSGSEIPFFGRIVALADVFDALSSRRIYKPPFARDKVLGILQEERGKHFDPRILDLLLLNFAEMEKIQKKYPDQDEDFDKFRNMEKLKLEDIEVAGFSCTGFCD